jgi:hypothetical protein
MNALQQAVGEAAAAMLPPNTPSILAVQKVWEKDAIVATKESDCMGASCRRGLEYT